MLVKIPASVQNICTPDSFLESLLKHLVRHGIQKLSTK